MANRYSNFPNTLDQLRLMPEYQDLSISDKQNIERYNVLVNKSSLTTAETTELNNLITTLQDKMVNTSDFNKLVGAVNNMQEYFVNNVLPDISNLVNAGQTSIQTAKDNALIAIEQKKENIITYMDSTTAGQLQNQIGVIGDLTTTNKSSLVNAVNEINSNYTKTIPYATTSGTANNYTITLSPAPTSYIDGMAVSVKINIQNTGASTININGLGAKSILKGNGNVVSSGNLKANSIYTLRYNGTSFILQGEGGEYGTATQTEVLSGYTIGTENGLLNGTISKITSEPTTSSGYIYNDNYYMRVPQGYFDGSNLSNVKEALISLRQKVTSDATAQSKHMLNGESAYVNGNKVIGDIPTLPTVFGDQANATGTTIGQFGGDGKNYVYLGIPNNTFTGINSWVRSEQPDLIDSNIPLGKSIFGLAGTNINKKWASGNFADNNVINTINLSFTPSTVLVETYNLAFNNGSTAYYTTLLNPNSGAYSKVLKDARINVNGNNWVATGEGGNTGGSVMKTAGQIQVLTNQIKIKGFNTGELVYWIAIE